MAAQYDPIAEFNRMIVSQFRPHPHLTDVAVDQSGRMTWTCVDCHEPLPSPTPDPFRCAKCRKPTPSERV